MVHVLRVIIHLIQEVDLACAPFTGYTGYDAMELAVNILGDGYGIFIKYPEPKIQINGPIRTLSINVTDRCLTCHYIIQ